MARVVPHVRGRAGSLWESSTDDPFVYLPAHRAAYNAQQSPEFLEWVTAQPHYSKWAKAAYEIEDLWPKLKAPAPGD